MTSDRVTIDSSGVGVNGIRLANSAPRNRDGAGRPLQLTPDEIIDQKLRDAETPGYEVTFDPDEAEKIAFYENALSDQDARESVEDL